jgi:hypothetical protein
LLKIKIIRRLGCTFFCAVCTIFCARRGKKGRVQRAEDRDQVSPVKFVPVKQEKDRFHRINAAPFLRKI